MDILTLLLLIAIWLYVGWRIRRGIGNWKAKREYHKALHPQKRRDWSLKRAVRHDQPKRRTSYRPPNKDA